MKTTVDIIGFLILAILQYFVVSLLTLDTFWFDSVVDKDLQGGLTRTLILLLIIIDIYVVRSTRKQLNLKEELKKLKDNLKK